MANFCAWASWGAAMLRPYTIAVSEQKGPRSGIRPRLQGGGVTGEGDPRQRDFHRNWDEIGWWLDAVNAMEYITCET